MGTFDYQSLLKVLIIMLGLVGMVYAGPPFITDDPDPTDYHNYEFYFFGAVQSARHSRGLLLPALEANYGIFHNTEAHLLVPITTIKDMGYHATGLGDTELGIKYKLPFSDKLPAIAITPTALVPTGNFRLGIGSGRMTYLLPAWIGKHFKKWYVYGGGGYFINAEPNSKNLAFAGIVVQREVSDKLMIGAEIFTQGRSINRVLSLEDKDEKAFTLLNIGTSYEITKKLTILASVGHSFIGVNQWFGYLALYTDIPC